MPFCQFEDTLLGITGALIISDRSRKSLRMATSSMPLTICGRMAKNSFSASSEYNARSLMAAAGGKPAHRIRKPSRHGRQIVQGDNVRIGRPDHQRLIVFGGLRIGTALGSTNARSRRQVVLLQLPCSPLTTENRIRAGRSNRGHQPRYDQVPIVIRHVDEWSKLLHLAADDRPGQRQHSILANELNWALRSHTPAVGGDFHHFPRVVAQVDITVFRQPRPCEHGRGTPRPVKQGLALQRRNRIVHSAVSGDKPLRVESATQEQLVRLCF